ncbi:MULTISPECIES: LysR family transcriptional regulator [unclassified Butyrivibrio]|uniref:LysR family transcriptional regulator n=1 Tax=unclassified Butyrivibrio TaxID=2639466 RepID=UPI0003B6C054|nr:MULTISPECIES: LysR family transcriptional regulator [unclassified Butyrivibrio]SEL02321.1 DNA-binding transcriptional regulator, LysR family [Butyrivibrio sp. ob235]
MTILQLKYVIAIDEESSMRKAADRLYVSQPGLSSAVRDLEKELGIQIFERVHNGVVTTSAGASFIAYARHAVEQFEIVEEKYLNSKSDKPTFSVSMQHYTIAVNAFIETVKEYDLDEYQFSIRETQTSEVIEDIKNMKSEIGVIALSDFNKNTFKKIFTDASLEFHELFTRNTYVYLRKDHPLADKEELSLEELSDYPCMVFDQGDNTSFYYREEALATYDYKKIISTNERATSIELMLGLNGYAVGAAMLGDSLNESDLKAVKLKEDETLTFGYITRKGVELSEMGETFVEKLEEYLD